MLLWAAAVTNRHFQNDETTSSQKAVEKTVRQQHYLCCWCYSHLSCNELLPVHRSSSSQYSSLLWFNVLLADDWEWRHREPLYLPYHEPPLVIDKGTHVRFCWIPSNRGIEGNERVDQLAKETLDHDIDPLASIHYAYLKPLVNSYIQQWCLTWIIP